MPRLLIVDDQSLNRELLHAYLEEFDYELVDAASGEEALEIAAAQTPDLVLLDVMMPGMDGFETARRLKDLAGDTFLPIVLLTSLSDQASRLRGLEEGADEFLTKPVDRLELGVRVRNLLTLRDKEVALIDRNVALLELNRFKDEMSSLIVHDLKNPMAVIQSSLDYIARTMADGTVDPTQLEALDDSRTAGRRITRLLANLLDLARLEANKLKLQRRLTPVAPLLIDLVTQRKGLAEARRISLALDADDHLTLDADPDLLSRVIENILDNALRHTPPCGRISVSTDAHDHIAQIRIGNTGLAIPADVRPVLFEKFGKALPSVGRMNLGLGLYFCRLAAEAHGGSIWVEETAPLPTVFVVQLPAA